MNWLRSLIARSPRPALIIGKIVFLIGGILVLSAVFARGGLTGINSDRVAAKLPALQTLAQAYPQYPTWFVPEGPVGYVIAAVLVLLGTTLIVIAGEVVNPKQRMKTW